MWHLPAAVGQHHLDLAALTAAAVASAAGGDPSRALVAASTLAALTEVLLVGAGVLRLGFMADFISAPVLAGFKAGVGLLIAAGQLGKVLGVPQEDGDFFVKVGSALSHLGDLSWLTFALAAVSVAILLGLRRWAPPSVPGPLIVVALGIVLAAATGLADRGVALVGTIPPGLPQFAAPDLDLVGQLLPSAAGVALMAFVESIAAGRAFTAKGEPEVDADQELRALGAANLAGGCFQAFPAGGGLSQTAVNRPVAPIYFANAPRLRGRLLDLVDACEPPPSVLVLDLDAVPDIDVTALDLLPSFDADLRERSVTLWLANPNARPLDMLRRLPDADTRERRLYRDLDYAAAAFAAAHSSSSGDEPGPGPPPP